ncbi:MAG: peptidoglycan DD-metalloendopeptidase family protein [Clostridia bacterium]|nr:peptidoglycan DD-metalloendopeptidase family protein [Clostridia bacterium]
MKKICQKIIVIITTIIFLTSYNISLAVSQSDINNQKSQQEENKNKINEKQAQIDEVQEIKDETLKEVEELNNQIATYQGQITSLESQINDANKKIKEAEEKLKKSQEDYESQQKTLEERMVAVYEAGDTSYLDVLLSSTSVTDFISNYYLVSEVTQYDVELLDKIQKQKEEIENAKKELENGKNELTTTKASKESVSSQLKSAKSAKDAKVSQLSAEEQQLQNQIAELQKDNEAINKKIQSMQAQIEAERKKAEASKNNNNSTSSSGQASNSGTSSAGFIKPVNSYITTGLYYSSGSFHGAVDYGASGINGMPVYAVADGIVVTTQALTTSYGNYIIIYHPSSNLYTLYAHGQAGSICVSEMQRVKQGQQIMRVGNTGNSTGPHLHFEVRTSPGYYSNRVDPRGYLPN